MEKRGPLPALDEFTPKARGTGLLVRKVSRELVVYDLDRHRAHCLGETAAAVFSRCDGRTSVAEIARAAGSESMSSLDTRAALAAVRRLERAHLLEAPVPRRRALDSPARRSLLRGVAVTGGLAVLSLTVPTPEAAAATCLPRDACVRRDSCTDLQGNQCCSGSCRSGGTVCGTGQNATPWACN